MPDEEIQVMPARASAPCHGSPSNRRGVEQEIDDAGRRVPPEGPEQLAGRELQPQGQQEEDDADLGGGDDEGLGGGQRHHTPLAEGQRRHQDERDGRQAQAPGQHPQHGQPEEQQPEFDQQGGDVIHSGGA
jgi:hypothetical protein